MWSDPEKAAQNLISGKQALLVLDGDCGLCHKTGAWLAARDRQQHLLFTTLADWSAAGASIPADTVLLLGYGKLLTHSRAVLYAIIFLGGIWKLARFFLLLPQEMSDSLYNVVAKRRLRIAGQAQACDLSAIPALRKRLIPGSQLKSLLLKLTNDGSYNIRLREIGNLESET